MSENIFELGFNELDFDKKIYRAHCSWSNGNKIISSRAEVPFADITAIEIHKPFWIWHGIIKFIIKDKRYVSSSVEASVASDFIFSPRIFKEDFSSALDVIEKFKEENKGVKVKICGRKKFAFDVPVETYKGNYDVTDEVAYEIPSKEKSDGSSPDTLKYLDYDVNAPVGGKKESSVIGSAVVGGVIAGPAGAVVGAIHAANKNNKNK